MHQARLRFLSLWISQTLRVLSDWCLRVFVVLEWAKEGARETNSAWHLATACFILPFIVLAPFNGILSNDLPRRWVLVGSAGFCLLSLLTFGSLGGPWLACLIFVALGSAVYSPTRYAMLPAASEETHIPLGMITSWIEIGGAGGIVCGLLLGSFLHDRAWADVPAIWSGFIAGWVPRSWPAAIGVSAGLSSFSLLAALPVKFRSDPYRTEAPGQAVQGFFRDGRRIAEDRESLGSLVGLACLLALMVAGSGAIFAKEMLPDSEGMKKDLVYYLILVALGVALGSWTAGLQTHRVRALGLVPFATLGLLAAIVWLMLFSNLTFPSLLLGFMSGLANVPLRTYYQAAVPADARGNAMAIMNMVIHLTTALLAGLMVVLTQSALIKSPGQQLFLLLLLATIGAGAAWYFLLRNSLEQALEIVVLPIYRIRGYGPGLESFPAKGPVIIVANHSAWFDPLWLGKVAPRFVTPMMTSVYYDKPVMRWLMTRVVGTIRVPAGGFRREAPELNDAVKALDKGLVVLIFPEGALRKRADQFLRFFGQGVWRILSDRPKTPVVACWIEGGWESYASYYKGPPTVNKRFDWWRTIRVGMAPPQTLDPELLKNPRATRLSLMQSCLDARSYLGLAQVKADEPRSQLNERECEHADNEMD
ncbi:MAG TPA: MFS transporter [Gemmataceae bacterium]|nr:MFS transporter [Gemmataceae bacterium]